VVDAAKVDARVAEFEAEAVSHEQTAERLEQWADDERREAHRLRGQNVRLLETARQHGYPEPTDSGSASS
jgi:hypothetical protein